jgi:hypothetical protein
MLHGIPPSLLVVLEVESQLGPTIGALYAGATVKEGHVQWASPSQYAEGVGGQISLGVRGVSWVLGNGRQGMQAGENEVEDGQGVMS